MVTCAVCGKFIPKTGVCTYCKRNNLKDGETSGICCPTLLSTSDNTLTRFSLINVSEDLGGINAVVLDIRNKLSTVEEMKSEIITKLDDLTYKFEQCLRSLSTITSTVSDLAVTVDSLANDQRAAAASAAMLEQRVVALEKLNSSSTPGLLGPSSPLASVTKRLYIIERNSRDLEIAITNLPYVPNEDLNDTIAHIASALNVEYTRNDVSFAQRLHRSSSNNKPLIVRFVSVFIRDNWISCTRAKRDLYASDIITDWPRSLVYINERSTADERKRFAEAKKLARSNNIQFVWMKRGITYLRKDDISPVQRYNGPQDIVPITLSQSSREASINFASAAMPRQ